MSQNDNQETPPQPQALPENPGRRKEIAFGVILGGVVATLGSWMASEGDPLLTILGGLLGAEIGLIFVDSGFMVRVVLASSIVGMFWGFPDLAQIKGSDPKMCLIKVAACMLIGLVIGSIFQGRKSRIKQEDK